MNEATAAMAEAHSLQLCLLGLQHEINEISTVAAETPTPSSESVEAEAEADDSPMAPRLFEGHQVLDGGGFRTLQHAFATHTECAQAPLTPLPPSMRSEAHAMHTPCTRHAHAMHVVAQLGWAASKGAVTKTPEKTRAALEVRRASRVRGEGIGGEGIDPREEGKAA